MKNFRRDLFAFGAMIGIYHQAMCKAIEWDKQLDKSTIHAAARHAYIIADAMLEARK